MKLLKKYSLFATPMSHSFNVNTLSDFNREIQISETVHSNIHKNERLIKLNTKPGK
jgi:hypothetical protein